MTTDEHLEMIRSGCLAFMGATALRINNPDLRPAVQAAIREAWPHVTALADLVMHDLGSRAQNHLDVPFDRADFEDAGDDFEHDDRPDGEDDEPRRPGADDVPPF
jgi:hypothetical protein